MMNCKIVLTWLGLFSLINAQCLIQNELCSCPRNRIVWTLTCTAISTAANTTTTFPYKEIKTELEKVRPIQFYLVLRNKNYVQLPAMAFENIGVFKLVLSANSIAEVDKDALRGSFGVIQLIIQDNVIKSVRFLRNIANVLKIDLSNNLIEIIENGTFLGLNRLEDLNLDFNKIS
jgi:hypothetical protein